MVKLIIFDEANEILNIEKFLKDDVDIVGYLKSDKSHFDDYINGIRVYDLNDLCNILSEIGFDYILVNSRRYNIIYDKIRELNINPECILDVSFFFYDTIISDIRDRLSYCRDEKSLNFDIMFMGRNYIKDKFICEYFNDYINISNIFSDVHYDYHLLYYLIRSNKIHRYTKIGIFTNYSMIYENIDLKDDKYDFIKIFEDIFSVHKNVSVRNTFSSFCCKNFKSNVSRIFKRFNLDDIVFGDDFNISCYGDVKIQYETQIETINYKEANVIAFKMNKNIINQTLKILRDNMIDVFFIVPPVHRLYRTYVNKTLQKEFYMILNKNLNDNLCVFDYFDLEFDDNYFSSPSNLNYNGCREFLKILSKDINNKFLNVIACNNL